MADKSQDLLGVFKDVWETGTQELSKNVSSMLGSATSAQEQTPEWKGNQISVSQEKWEKATIEARK